MRLGPGRGGQGDLILRSFLGRYLPLDNRMITEQRHTVPELLRENGRLSLQESRYSS